MESLASKNWLPQLMEMVQDESSSTESAKEYSENVVERVMKKFEITDKDAFLLYAKEFDENDNDYLTEAELKKAAESFTTIEDEEVTDEKCWLSLMNRNS